MRVAMDSQNNILTPKIFNYDYFKGGPKRYFPILKATLVVNTVRTKLMRVMLSN